MPNNIDLVHACSCIINYELFLVCVLLISKANVVVLCLSYLVLTQTYSCYLFGKNFSRRLASAKAISMWSPQRIGRWSTMTVRGVSVAINKDSMFLCLPACINYTLRGFMRSNSNCDYRIVWSITPGKYCKCLNTLNVGYSNLVLL